MLLFINMTFKGIALTYFLCLSVAVTSAQTPAVLDTSGEPLRRGVGYHIRPAAASDGGRLTLVSRPPTLTSCPQYVGQESTSSSAGGGSFTFGPFAQGDGMVFEGRDLKVVSVGPTPCAGETMWRLGSPAGGSQLIEVVVAGGSGDEGQEYFQIVGSGAVEGSYEMVWCPVEYCAPECSPPIRCGEVGSLVENGTRLLAMDTPNSPLRVVFERAN